MSKAVFVAVFAIVLSAAPPVAVHARPSFATKKDNNCNACHVTVLPGQMEVTATSVLTDLGTQLDGSNRGPLKTYRTTSGNVVTLSVKVLNGRDRFAVQIKAFEKPAQKNSRTNSLIWSEANDDGNVWTRQQVENPPYFTKDNGDNGGISGSVTPTTFTFDLMIDAATPPDVYELTFAAVGRRGRLGRWYQQERFYIEVLNPSEFSADANKINSTAHKGHAASSDGPPQSRRSHWTDISIVRLVRPAGILTLSLLVLTVTAGLLRRRKPKLLLKWHKRLGIATLISAAIHLLIILMAR